MTPSYRLGVDIGGTFTDAILINELTGEIRVGKVPFDTFRPVPRIHGGDPPNAA